MSQPDDVLKETPLFEALSDEDSSALRSGIIDVNLDRGERLFAEGDAGDKLYIILSGKIKLTKAAPDGRENLLSVHGPGEMFGELSLFDPVPRTSSATAVVSARLAWPGPRRPADLAEHAPRGRHAPAPGPGSAAAPDQ